MLQGLETITKTVPSKRKKNLERLKTAVSMEKMFTRNVCFILIIRILKKQPRGI